MVQNGSVGERCATLTAALACTLTLTLTITLTIALTITLTRLPHTQPHTHPYPHPHRQVVTRRKRQSRESRESMESVEVEGDAEVKALRITNDLIVVTMVDVTAAESNKELVARRYELGMHMYMHMHIRM